MSSLYINRKNCHLTYKNKTIAIYEKNALVTTIPLFAIKRIFIASDVTLKSELISNLAMDDIKIIIVGGRQKAVRCFMNMPHNDATTRVNQFDIHPALKGEDSYVANPRAS